MEKGNDSPCGQPGRAVDECIDVQDSGHAGTILPGFRFIVDVCVNFMTEDAADD